MLCLQSRVSNKIDSMDWINYCLLDVLHRSTPFVHFLLGLLVSGFAIETFLSSLRKWR